MTRIGLISDTHGFLDPQVFTYFKNCHEIWHAGDFGNRTLADELQQKSGLPVRGVYGNIDGQDIRTLFPEALNFQCEAVQVYINHIGGYPGRYAPGVQQALKQQNAQLFVSGHSHILKVQYDPKLNCLHMNPGAAGKHGWHKIRTLIRFVIDGSAIKDAEVIELGSRSALPGQPASA